MATCAQLIDDNLAFLQQARELVQRLSSQTFARSGPSVHGSSVGAHLRHILDHYANLLSGLPAHRIDYDARERDANIEVDREAALRRISEIMERLAALRAAEDEAVTVKMDCGENTDPDSWWVDSTLRRECQFLVSHTVHHFALIRLILAAQGIEPGPAFGVAPSTLRHHARLACAQ
jgi:uncharacterized damage-inducible protein DinB